MLKAPAVAASLPSSKVIALPVVLVVGFSPAFEARCRELGTRAKLLVRACAIPFCRPLATRVRPHLMLVPARIYELAPRGFELLAEDAGARLVTLESEDLPRVVLETQLLDARRWASMECTASA